MNVRRPCQRVLNDLYVEGQVSLQSYDSAPRPPPPPCVFWAYFLYKNTYVLQFCYLFSLLSSLVQSCIYFLTPATQFSTWNKIFILFTFSLPSVPVYAYIHICTCRHYTQATVAALVLLGTRGTLCTLENQPAVNCFNLHSQKTALNLSRFRAHPC
jgi:hypothetical protein